MATKLLQLIDAEITHLNDTVKLLSNLPKQYSMTYATGVWLDNLNLLIGGTVRPYRYKDIPMYSDTELRIRMGIKVRMNNGGGSLESVMLASRYYLYLNNDNTWNSVQSFELNVYNDSTYVIIEAVGEAIKNPDKIREIQNFVPVGVGVLVVETWEDGTFRLYNEDGVLVDPVLGLSDITQPTSGGKLVEILYKS